MYSFLTLNTQRPKEIIGFIELTTFDLNIKIIYNPSLLNKKRKSSSMVIANSYELRLDGTTKSEVLGNCLKVQL